MAAFTQCKENEIAFDVLPAENSSPDEDIIFRGENLIEEMTKWEGEMSELLDSRLHDSSLDVQLDTFKQYLGTVSLDWNITPPLLGQVKRKSPGKKVERLDLTNLGESGPDLKKTLRPTDNSKKSVTPFVKSPVQIKSPADEKEEKKVDDLLVSHDFGRKLPHYLQDDDGDDDVASPKSSITS